MNLNNDKIQPRSAPCKPAMPGRDTGPGRGEGRLGHRGHVALPFGKNPPTRAMQAHGWEREPTGAVLFCYLLKLSLIPLILLELIWLNSLPLLEASCHILGFCSNHPNIEGKRRASQRGGAVGRATSGGEWGGRTARLNRGAARIGARTSSGSQRACCC